MSIIRVANRHVLLSGHAQSSEGTYESGAVVVVRYGFQGVLEAFVLSQGLYKALEVSLFDGHFPEFVSPLPSWDGSLQLAKILFGQEHSQKGSRKDFQNASLVNGVGVLGGLDVEVPLIPETDNQLG